MCQTQCEVKGTENKWDETLLQSSLGSGVTPRGSPVASAQCPSDLEALADDLDPCSWETEGRCAGEAGGRARRPEETAP